MSGSSEKASTDDVGEPPPDTPDPKAVKEERRTFESKPNFTELRNTRFQEQTAQLRLEHLFRLWTAGIVFAFVVGWMVVVTGIVIAQGFKWLDLSEKVLIGLLVTTTFNVLGLLATAIRYFFPADRSIFGQTELPSTRSSPAREKPKDKPNRANDDS